MSKIKDIPAFPTDEQREGLNGGIIYGKAHPGMTLRDYFAGQALFAASIGMEKGLDMESDFKIFANRCYILADAMLAERWKK